ncbi:hypothetical protein F2Q70_00024730 [Brassica cretica]|uniref:Uncharacterized protein n=1 Tax=Brassica cretica TaxID=69181 RepID=A0A8S9LHM8_BRACR|nr:hypothetical protein F2Q70_00024730 [Brassica cretica]
MMCVDHGVRLGDPILQWWSDLLSTACHVKWVAPMDNVQGREVRAPWCEGIPGCVARGSVL